MPEFDPTHPEIGHQPAGPGQPRRTMFGLPVIRCGLTDFEHEWHSNGATFCPGWAATAWVCPSPVQPHGGHTWRREDDPDRLLWCRGERLSRPAAVELAGHAAPLTLERDRMGDRQAGLEENSRQAAADRHIAAVERIIYGPREGRFARAVDDAIARHNREVTPAPAAPLCGIGGCILPAGHVERVNSPHRTLSDS